MHKMHKEGNGEDEDGRDGSVANSIPMRVLTVILLLCVVVRAAGKEYGPHQASGKRWFEGWYTRFVGQDGWSFGVIFGAYPRLSDTRLNATFAFRF
jgi:hypothetical protein